MEDTFLSTQHGRQQKGGHSEAVTALQQAQSWKLSVLMGYLGIRMILIKQRLHIYISSKITHFGLAHISLEKLGRDYASNFFPIKKGLEDKVKRTK